MYALQKKMVILGFPKQKYISCLHLRRTKSKMIVEGNLELLDGGRPTTDLFSCEEKLMSENPLVGAFELGKKSQILARICHTPGDGGNIHKRLREEHVERPSIVGGDMLKCSHIHNAAHATSWTT